MIYVMYNPLAGNSTCEESCREVGRIFSSDEIKYIDLLTIDDLEGYIRDFAPEDMRRNAELSYQFDRYIKP